MLNESTVLKLNLKQSYKSWIISQTVCTMSHVQSHFTAAKSKLKTDQEASHDDVTESTFE